MPRNLAAVMVLSLMPLGLHVGAAAATNAPAPWGSIQVSPTDRPTACSPKGPDQALSTSMAAYCHAWDACHPSVQGQALTDAATLDADVAARGDAGPAAEPATTETPPPTDGVDQMQLSTAVVPGPVAVVTKECAEATRIADDASMCSYAIVVADPAKAPPPIPPPRVIPAPGRPPGPVPILWRLTPDSIVDHITAEVEAATTRRAAIMAAVNSPGMHDPAAVAADAAAAAQTTVRMAAQAERWAQEAAQQAATTASRAESMARGSLREPKCKAPAEGEALRATDSAAKARHAEALVQQLTGLANELTKLADDAARRAGPKTASANLSGAGLPVDLTAIIARALADAGIVMSGPGGEAPMIIVIPMAAA